MHPNYQRLTVLTDPNDMDLQTFQPEQLSKLPEDVRKMVLSLAPDSLNILGRILAG